MHIPFWLGVAGLAPIILPQALHTRRTTLRLPEGSGPSEGQWGDGNPGLRLLVIGESTAASVGVDSHQQGLASQLARQLSQQGKTVAWHTRGTNGIRMAALLDQLRRTGELPACDAIFISMGVNDTTGLTTRKQYYRQLEQLIGILRDRRPDAVIYLLAIPPMHRFTALPSPLRAMLGWRSRLLDLQQQKLAHALPGLLHLGYPDLDNPALLARDGYHPGELGYQVMAEAIARQIS
ncbi:SGNH/GDSL hydrolase family protein [Alcanivorax sp. S6407]|uniref:SGNH/GDSL hydrolase family protein n=1 Tax=Alcanivorax sp. S6407 TaxID=2926424 RepID=UPI001FF6A988|nr:SGNH/GDSL hydrolase family protein [Alcanivorax sp. S6407]MCK0155007.1 SGNH/GDSL hydrolase family protein [Alcanivorax sp. S6407]